MVVAGVRQVEHHQEVLRPAQGKLHVAATAQLEALQRRPARGHGLAHDGGEPFEPLRGDGRQQLVFADKVAIGRVVGNAGAAGDLTQRERAGADLADQGHGSVEQGLAQVDVMVRLGTRHVLFSNRIC